MEHLIESRLVQAVFQTQPVPSPWTLCQGGTSSAFPAASSSGRVQGPAGPSQCTLMGPPVPGALALPTLFLVIPGPVGSSSVA